MLTGPPLTAIAEEVIELSLSLYLLTALPFFSSYLGSCSGFRTLSGLFVSVKLVKDSLASLQSSNFFLLYESHLHSKLSTQIQIKYCDTTTSRVADGGGEGRVWHTSCHRALHLQKKKHAMNLRMASHVNCMLRKSSLVPRPFWRG